MTTGKARFAIVLTLVFLSVVPYLRILGNDFVNWDDDLYVYDNPLLKSEHGLHDIWFTLDAPNYYPLTYTFHYLEKKAFGDNPSAYHAISILLHLLNVILLFYLLAWLGLPLKPAWLATALFAVHPVQVETIAWVAEQKTLLATAGALGASMAWISWRKSGKIGLLVLLYLLYCLSLLSKTITVTLPLVFLFMDAFQGRGLIQKKTLAAISGLLAIAFGLGMVTLAVEKNLGSTGSVVASMGLIDRFLLAARSLLTYPMMVLLPTLTAPIHPLPKDPSGPIGWLALGIVLFFAVSFIYLFKKHARSPEIFGTAWYVLTIAPLLGWVASSYMRYGVIADRYLYLPGIGLFLAVAGPAVRFEEFAYRKNVYAGKSAIVAGLALVGALGGYSMSISGCWKNSGTLWEKVLESQPDSVLARSNLAEYLYRKGKMREAEKLLNQAIERSPDDPEVMNNLAALKLRSGKYAQALELSLKARRKRPAFIEAVLNSGLAYLGLRRPADAEEELKAVLHFRPRSARALNGLGLALAMQQRTSEAIRYFHDAVKAAPGFSEAWRNLAFAYFLTGRIQDSERCYEKAASITPGDPALWSSWAHARAGRGDMAGAKDILERGMHYLPGSSLLKSQAKALDWR
ncbi:MAG: tetratricopeptide repeat protein [Deltaproteobacteria bacterium]|nr:tetratricopeptide repeat protein [Deltaproteobacteria bacterium]